jgi:putative sterol carrier protein
MTIEQYIRQLESSFLPTKAAGKRAVLQYVFTGRKTGVCHAVIEGGAIHAASGPHPAPTVIVETDIDLWTRIVRYDVDGLLAYQEGLIRVTGDVETLIESDTWFRHD